MEDKTPVHLDYNIIEYFHMMEKDLLMRLSNEINKGFTDMACDYNECNHTISDNIKQVEKDMKENKEVLNQAGELIDSLTLVIKNLRSEMISLRKEVATLKAELNVLKCDVNYGK